MTAGDEFTDGLVGTRWRINDSGTVFRVVALDGDLYATVENENGPPRRRRIRVRALRTTSARNGYTQIVT